MPWRSPKKQRRSSLSCGGDFRITSVTSEDAGSGEIAEDGLVGTGCPTIVPIV